MCNLEVSDINLNFVGCFPGPPPWLNQYVGGGRGVGYGGGYGGGYGQRQPQPYGGGGYRGGGKKASGSSESKEKGWLI